ncbi:MAG: PP2C family protein-serine/threonine phosphatase [Acidobacteria bacterium]|nr:PP2C family protein-serine/threonine phosphatase [Acidobacteriota bacterium]
MLNRGWLALLIAGLIGYSITLFLFPKVDPAARWNFTLNRNSAIAKARESAGTFGINASGWTARVRARYHRNYEYFLSRYPGFPSSGLLSPATVTVILSDPHSKRSYQTTINTRGEIIGYQWKESSPPSTGENASGDLALAENAAKKIIGSGWDRYKLSASSEASSENAKGQADKKRTYTWEAADELITMSVTVVVESQRVKDLSTQGSFNGKFKNEYDQRRSGFLSFISNTDNIILLFSLILVIIFYFVALGQRRIVHRLTLTFLAAVCLFLLTNSILGSFADRLFMNIFSGGSNWIDYLLSFLVLMLLMLVLGCFLYLLLAAGLAQSYKLPDRKTISLELLLKGKVLTKPVVNAILAGLLTGGIFSAVPYLAAATGLFQEMELTVSRFEDNFVARYPAITSFTTDLQIYIFLVFAFLGPLINAYIKRPMIARTLIFLLALICLLGPNYSYVSAPAAISISSLLAALLTTIYYRVDLVAVMVTCMASQSVFTSAAMLAQGAGSLRASGTAALIGLGALIIISLAGLQRARLARDEEIASPVGLASTQVERERLKAEFNVARRAQQLMIPDALPNIEGVEIAAVCRPSREVGGDLYDFINLPDGKLGIVVADVSGKGVPASLYMTLTKGLLDSVTEEKTDPGEILREVNRHLYEVCRRKVFVTLFLGIIDPVNKMLVYARAGHNPSVFRKSSNQQTFLLKSPGMGMGLNNGSIFDSSLKVSSLKLESNDMLFFYSDGITEAMNGNNEQYGEERLMRIAAEVEGLKAEEARNKIMLDVETFLGNLHPQDDQTLVVARVL